MSTEEIFFSPYQIGELEAVVRPRLDAAFRDGAISPQVSMYGINKAASRWGDARRTLTLFRRAGEMATERDLDEVTVECLDQNLDTTDKEATVEKLLNLPVQHFFVLNGVTAWTKTRTGEIIQPVTTDKVKESYNRVLDEEARVSERAIRDLITDLETMGLVETWIQSKGSEGRVKQIETTFDPQWVHDTRDQYIEQSPNLGRRD